MNLGHIEIFVKDPLKSKEFYIGVLGFTLEEVQKDKYVWLKMGGREILLRPGKNDSRIEDYQSTMIGLVLYTDDLERSVDELTARGVVFKGTDLSEKCLTFTDPDGNWFQLVNPEDH